MKNNQYIVANKIITDFICTKSSIDIDAELDHYNLADVALQIMAITNRKISVIGYDFDLKLFKKHLFRLSFHRPDVYINAQFIVVDSGSSAERTNIVISPSFLSDKWTNEIRFLLEHEPYVFIRRHPVLKEEVNTNG